MDCNEYANNLVSAHADGELTPQELTAVNEHVSGCARCTSRLEEERALKQILRRRADQMHAPQQLSRRIAALAAEPPKAKKRRGRIWQPIAAAMAIAAAAVFYFTIGRDLLTPANPQFDQAIESYTEFEKNFQPNVTASNVASLGEQYRAHTDVPVFVWNFSPVSFELVGGRVDKLSDGRTVIYTLYRGGDSQLMCERYKDPAAPMPSGGTELNGIHRVYRYHGYTICLTRDGNVTCMLVSRMPSADFAKAMTAIEG